MRKMKYVLPLRPEEEVELEIYSRCKDRQKLIKELSYKYIGQYTKCLNEIFNEQYRKTTMDSRIVRKKALPFYITVYSKYSLSNDEVYAISESYKWWFQVDSHPTKEDFLGYLRWCYCQIGDIGKIEDRMRLYEHLDDSLMIILDVDPEELGFDPSILALTKSFNVQTEGGKYQTVIKAYTDFDIITSGSNPLSIEEVRSIAVAHREAEACVCEGEESATCSEFLRYWERSGFARKIKLYEYHDGFLEIEIK